MSPTSTSQVYPQLADHLVKAQDPASNDPFMRVQRELDDTKVILVYFTISYKSNINDLF